MYHPLTRKHLYSATRVSVYFNEYGNEKSASGTAFFLRTSAGKLYLISNRHVFDASYSDPRKKDWILSKIVAAGYCDENLLPFDFSFIPPQILFPKNENEDVAAVDLSNVIVDGALPGSVVPIEESYLAAEADFSEVDISDIVAFPVYHGASNQPVMRTGWVASDPSQNFIGHGLSGDARRIAIEGFSWGGYSGSPVFTLDRGLQSGAGITYGGGFRGSKMIGVNAGHIKVADGSGAHAGLSYLIKSSVLIELLS